MSEVIIYDSFNQEKLNEFKKNYDFYIKSGDLDYLKILDLWTYDYFQEVVVDQPKMLYALLYLKDKRKGYYFLGAGNSVNKTSWQSTFGHCEIFRFMQKKFDINFIDLEGVNSPKRGWFKLSLGGNLVPYFKVKI